MSKPDAYEDYEPLQSVTPRSMSENQTDVNEKSAEQQVDEMSIASHSGEQLISPVMNELKSKIGTFDYDTDIPNADYPVPAVRNGVDESSEKLENGADDSDTDTLHGDNAPDNAQDISMIARGESGEASYLSMFGATNGSNQEDDIDAPQVSVMTPGGSSYFSLFDTDGKPLDVVMMSADDIADIKEEITESNLDALPSKEEAKADDDDLVDVVVVSQDDVNDIEKERGKSNVDVLNEIANEGVTDEERGNVQMLLQWARSKSTKMPKTFTMKAREARKLEGFRKAVDVGARNIVIFEKDATTEQNHEPVADQPKKNIQIKKTAEVKEPTDPGITREFLEKAITAYENGSAVVLLSMKLSKNSRNETVADIKAQLGCENAIEKSYHWIIKSKVQGKKLKNLNDYMMVNLGPKLTSSVKEVMNNKKVLIEAPGRQGSVKRNAIALPLHPLVYTDGKYEVYNDMSTYKHANKVYDGFDLSHMKAALKGLAQFHAVSFAHFSANKAGKKTLDDLIDNPYNGSLSEESIRDERAKLSAMFDTLIQVIRSSKGNGAESAAKKLESRFKADRLFNIYREALEGSNKFSTLCHGFPTTDSFKFSYDGQNSDTPVGVEIVGFDNMRYTNAMVDVHILFGTSLSPEIQNRAQFLLRFVYHETLTATLTALKVNPRDIIEFDDLQSEFKRTDTFGRLASAMHLAKLTKPGELTMENKPTSILNRKPVGTQKSVYSKILGGHIGGNQPSVINEKVAAPAAQTNEEVSSSPALRALELVQDLN